MKKIAALLAICVLFVGITPMAHAESLSYGRFTVNYTQNGVTVLVNGDDAAVMPLECDSFLRMVSKAYPISLDQADDVAGLSKISKKSYQDSRYGKQYIHPEALTALEALIEQAKGAGFRRTRIVETYRSSAVQQQRFNESVTKRVKQGMGEQEAYEAAHLVTALPGESEHHLGQTVDILQRGDSMGQSFGKTKFATWLAENAASFGFIVRYPDGMEATTGITYEPWHLRYVGAAFAAAAGQPGVCMETFYASLKTSRVVQVGDDALIIYVPAGGAAAVSPTLAQGAKFSETGEGGRVLLVQL